VSFSGLEKAGIPAALSTIVIDRWDALKSGDFVDLSFEGLDDPLLKSVVMIESEDRLLGFVLDLGSDSQFLLRHIQFRFLSWEGVSLLSEHFEICPESVWESTSKVIAHPRPPPGQFDSLIISDFQDIFEEFRRQRFSLLWRGSRDGFGVSQFHLGCDGHANTLTVILDTNGNIFGGFTPVKWDSDPEGIFKIDHSLKSFLFTLKNPPNTPAVRLPLKPDQKHLAILCDGTSGQCFGGGCDMSITNNCNAYFYNGAHIGHSYTNNTGVDGSKLFAVLPFFKVKKIEIFEITD
jgi:hypothetical protein